MCWGGYSVEVNKELIDRIIRRLGRVVISHLPKVDALHEVRVRKKLKAISNDSSHPLHDEFQTRVIPRRGRLRTNRSVTNRYTNSFVGQAIKLFNVEFVR